MLIYEINQIVAFVVFIILFFVLLQLVRIIKMTVGKLRLGYILFFAAIATFSVFVAFNAFVSRDLIQVSVLWSNMLVVIFALLLLAASYVMRSMVLGLGDMMIILEVISKKKFDNHIISRLKDFNHSCYLTLEKPVEEIRRMLKEKNINTSKIYFIDGTHGACTGDNCLSIENTPKEILSAWNKVLTEKRINCIFFDNVDSIRGLKDFEIAAFVGELAAGVREAKTRGFLMSVKGRTDERTIKDIEMFLDGVRNI